MDKMDSSLRQGDRGIVNGRARIKRVLILIAAGFLGLSGCGVKNEPTNLESRARRIHARILTLDSHCDTPFNLLRDDWKFGDRHGSDLEDGGTIDLPRMIEGGLDAEFFAVFVGQNARTAEGNAQAKETALKTLDAIDRMLRDYSDLIGLALSPADAVRLKKEGRRIAFIGLENGFAIGNDLSLIKTYFDRGVRYLTLCHASDNDIGDSSTDSRDPPDRGLSEFGLKVVLECNRLGLIVDISHASDKTFADVLKVSRAPVIASHSCCRTLCDSPRNLTDDMLKALAKNGGVIQICFYSDYVKKPLPNPERDRAMTDFEARYGEFPNLKDEAVRKARRSEREAIMKKYPRDKAAVRDLVDHIDHVVKLIGIDHAGIGTDFDGGGGLSGCEDVSGLIHVTEELIRRGYNEKEIEKIWSGNFMRVFRNVIEVSVKQQNCK